MVQAKITSELLMKEKRILAKLKQESFSLECMAERLVMSPCHQRFKRQPRDATPAFCHAFQNGS
jgi:hypothetical protein